MFFPIFAKTNAENFDDDFINGTFGLDGTKSHISVASTRFCSRAKTLSTHMLHLLLVRYIVWVNNIQYPKITR